MYRRQIKRFYVVINALMCVHLWTNTCSFDAHLWLYLRYHKKKKHLMDKLSRYFVFWQTLGCLHQTICTSQYFLMNFTNEKIKSNAQQHTHQNRVFILRVGSVLIDCNLSNIFVIIKNKCKTLDYLHLERQLHSWI